MATVKLNGDTSGYVELTVPAVSGTSTLTFPAVTANVVTTADTSLSVGNSTVNVSINSTAISVNTYVLNSPCLVRAALTSNQTCNATTTWYKLNCSNVQIDTDSFYTGSNATFKPTKAGYYRISVNVTGVSSNAAAYCSYAAGIFKNGTAYSLVTGSGSGSATQEVTDIVYLNGTTDYVQPYGQIGPGSGGDPATGTLTFYSNYTPWPQGTTWFSAEFIRA